MGADWICLHRNIYSIYISFSPHFFILFRRALYVACSLACRYRLPPPGSLQAAHPKIHINLYMSRISIFCLPQPILWFLHNVLQLSAMTSAMFIALSIHSLSAYSHKVVVVVHGLSCMLTVLWAYKHTTSAIESDVGRILPFCVRSVLRSVCWIRRIHRTAARCIADVFWSEHALYPPPLKCYSITVAAVAALFEREKCVRGTSKHRSCRYCIAMRVSAIIGKQTKN